MGIEARHAYRFVYLKSEQWQNVRLEALAREKGKCQICGEESIHNDAHHVWYPKDIWQTKERQLVILCRVCHTFIHEITPECITDDFIEGSVMWSRFRGAIIKWRKANLRLLNERNGLEFKEPKELRRLYEAFKEKVAYYEWLQYASHVKLLVADSDYQI